MWTRRGLNPLGRLEDVVAARRAESLCGTVSSVKCWVSEGSVMGLKTFGRSGISRGGRNGLKVCESLRGFMVESSSSSAPFHVPWIRETGSNAC